MRRLSNRNASGVGRPPVAPPPSSRHRQAARDRGFFAGSTRTRFRFCAAPGDRQSRAQAGATARAGRPRAVATAVPALPAAGRRGRRTSGPGYRPSAPSVRRSFQFQRAAKRHVAHAPIIGTPVAIPRAFCPFVVLPVHLLTAGDLGRRLWPASEYKENREQQDKLQQKSSEKTPWRVSGIEHKHPRVETFITPDTAFHIGALHGIDLRPDLPQGAADRTAGGTPRVSFVARQALGLAEASLVGNDPPDRRANVARSASIDRCRCQTSSIHCGGVRASSVIALR